MSFFRNKNKGGKGDIKLDVDKTAVQTTPPTDPNKVFWVDTSVTK